MTSVPFAAQRLLVIPANAGFHWNDLLLRSPVDGLWRGFAHLSGGRVTSLCFAKEK
jgi:hypothetical protein